MTLKEIKTLIEYYENKGYLINSNAYDSENEEFYIYKLYYDKEKDKFFVEFKE